LRSKTKYWKCCDYRRIYVQINVGDINTAASTSFVGSTATIAASTSYANVSLNPGDSIDLVYLISGTPDTLGNLKIDFSSVGGLTASATHVIANGQADFAFDFSQYYSSITDGTIATVANNDTFDIAYTNGLGSYDAFTSATVTVNNEYNGETRNLTISRAAGTYTASGNITYTIHTPDAPWSVPAEAIGDQTTHATFATDINGVTEGNINFIGIGGGTVTAGTFDCAGATYSGNYVINYRVWS